MKYMGITRQIKCKLCFISWSIFGLAFFLVGCFAQTTNMIEVPEDIGSIIKESVYEITNVQNGSNDLIDVILSESQYDFGTPIIRDNEIEIVANVITPDVYTVLNNLTNDDDNANIESFNALFLSQIRNDAQVEETQLTIVIIFEENHYRALLSEEQLDVLLGGFISFFSNYIKQLEDTNE